ncbi:hypothetical protein LV779_04120 [Streptomyces thinghirensis]|nr:hypothetical protein [Streptomyces thinghirensis]
MTMPADLDNDAAALREALTKSFAETRGPVDPAWPATVARVPRHVFVPGFYPTADERDGA